MNPDKITEFLYVLVFALLVGLGAVLSVLYLEGAVRGIAILVLLVASLVLWQYLRKRFGRAGVRR